MPVGLNNETLTDEFRHLLSPYVKCKLFTHLFAWFGSYDDQRSSWQYEVKPDDKTLFDLASLTKPLVTAALVMQLVHKNQLSLLSPISDWLPPASRIGWHPAILGLTVAELIEHRSGLPAWRNFWVTIAPRQLTSPESKANHIQLVLNRAACDLDTKTYRYSDLGFILLGYCLEQSANLQLSALFAGLKKDLQLSNSTDESSTMGYFNQVDRINAVPVDVEAMDISILKNYVHDENCRALGGMCGHAGLYASGESLVAFVGALFCSDFGKWWLKRIETEMLDTARKNILGWDRGSITCTKKFYGDDTLGHFGFTGTALFFHPQKQIAGILLSNRVISGRRTSLITNLRSEVYGFYRKLAESNGM